jgi:aminodeoxyfutalosine deaminase
MELLADRRIPLEVCPVSNFKTGALAKQLGTADATLQKHPLPKIIRQGIPVVLSSDDPAMFHTTLHQEYQAAHSMGLSDSELSALVANGFEYAFLSPSERARLNFGPAKGARQNAILSP